MTDEEMAVNWIRSQGWSEENLPSDEFNQMFQAFLAALKVGSLKWHKVADGDLPPCENGNFSINVLTDSGDIAYYEYDDDCWVEEPASVEIDTPVAWCEIPQYMEE